jgi:hypothetical protein
MKKRLLGIIAAAVGVLAAGAIAYAQAVVPIVTSLGSTDLVQIIKNGAPVAGNVYANISQLRAWIMGGNSAHSGTPALSSCGGGTPTVSGTDNAFTVTQGTTATGCVATFSQPFVTAPTCVAVNQTAPGTSTPAYTVSTTAVTLVTASTSGEIWDVVCVAHTGG